MSKSNENSIVQSQSEQSMGQEFHITALPREMMFRIFQLLPPQDLKSAVLVCKTWMEIAEDPSFWTWAMVTLDTEEDFLKLKIERLRLLQEIKVIHGYHHGYYGHLFNLDQCYWMGCGMTRLFKVINEIPTVRRIHGLECHYEVFSDIEPVLLVRVLNRLEELRLCEHERIPLTPEQLKLLFTAIAGKTNLKFLNVNSGGQEHLSKIDPELFAAALSNVANVMLEEPYVGDITIQQLMALFKAIISEDRPLKKLELTADPKPSIDADIMGSALNKLEEVTIIDFCDNGEQVSAIIRNLVDGESKLKRLMLANIDPDIIEGLNQDHVRRVRKRGEFYYFDEGFVYFIRMAAD